jgi:hypothetical protein
VFVGLDDSVAHGVGLVGHPVAPVVVFVDGHVADEFVAFLAAGDGAIGGVGRFAQFAFDGFGWRKVHEFAEVAGGEPVVGLGEPVEEVVEEFDFGLIRGTGLSLTPGPSFWIVIFTERQVSAARGRGEMLEAVNRRGRGRCVWPSLWREA